MILGALGGPHTFGGQAAAIMLSQYPEFSEITYVGSADEVLPPDGTSWHADAGIAPEQTSKTGFHVATLRTLTANASPGLADRKRVPARRTSRTSTTIMSSPGRFSA